jgi:hypothetical protein
MNLIDSITSDANQEINVVLDNGTRIVLTIIYKTNQSGWFYSISYGSIFNVNNRRVVTSPNMLRAFRDILPFGLACATDDGSEPVFIDDFSTGRAKMYSLNETDIANVESGIIANF